MTPETPHIHQHLPRQQSLSVGHLVGGGGQTVGHDIQVTSYIPGDKGDVQVVHPRDKLSHQLLGISIVTAWLL